jgi:hypothetical protein
MKKNATIKALKSKQPHVSKHKLKHAWLLSWMGRIGIDEKPDNDIIAILPGNKTEEFIKDLVDVLYCRNVHSAYDMARLAYKSKLRENELRQHFGPPSKIYYGTSSMIYARQVLNLNVERDEEQKKECLSWTEPAVWGNSPSGGSLVELHPARDCKLERPLKPLALEIY